MSITASHGSRIEVFGGEGQTPLTTYEIKSSSHDMKRTGVSALAYSPDGRWLAAGLRSGRVMIWDTAKEGGPAITLSAHKDRIVGLEFTPDGTSLVSGSKEGRVQFWDARKGWANSLSMAMDGPLSTIAISPDGTRLACGSDYRGSVFALADLTANSSSPRLLFDRESRQQLMRFGPDGETLAAAGNLNNVSVGMGLRNEPNLIDPEIGRSHLDDVHNLEFNPDGTLLVSGSADNFVKLWELASLRLLLRLPTLSESVVYPTFSPDGHTLAIGTSEGTRLYDVAGVTHDQSRVSDRSLTCVLLHWLRGLGASRFVTMTHGLSGTKPRSEDHITLCDTGSIRALKQLDSNAAVLDLPPAVGLDASPTRPLLAYSSNYRLWLADIEGTEPPRSCPVNQAASLSFGRDGKRLGCGR